MARLDSRIPAAVFAVIAAVFGAGCESEVIEYREVKRIDEPLTDAEIDTLLRIAASLPDGRVPDLSAVFLDPPQWGATRTLPVAELVREEQALAEERWSVEWLAERLGEDRELRRALRRERMTPEQFVGLTLAVGMAMSRHTLREDQDLAHLIVRGAEVSAALRDDQQPFAEHSRVGRADVLRQAAWITRAARAKRLHEVPEANTALVRARWNELEPVFPQAFQTNPFDPIADLLEDRGIPFTETPEAGSDDHIEWTRAEAIIGTDEPDEAASPGETIR